ncbi:thiolase domain-containing protein [Chachezhania sediminis]|uniref:thiolase domain-containing protein n=1 Tax=Chachezhania sediminis TaxID=2599291 RepID=UPI00131D1965|nr:thiolase domain-containing protein [Chachezhania sediminis]
MTTQGRICIAGIYEHPLRKAPDISTAQLHAECALGALQDAGLTFADVDAYYCAGDAPGGITMMANHMGLNLSQIDGTEVGGSSYILHLAHAAQAILSGRAKVALVTLAGRPKSDPLKPPPPGPATEFEAAYGIATQNAYAMCAMRHMHDYGTTSEQLAWIKVAASHHAQWNEHAMLRDVVTVDDVLNSPMIADPLHRMDCCVVSEGGGAFVVTSADMARDLGKPLVVLRGAAETNMGQDHGRNVPLTHTGAAITGPKAFAEAGVTVADIKYASIYDSFTITVLMQLEDLGFCEKGKGGAFVADGNLISGVGKLPWNTDGGGLCNNHPTNRGGLTKVLEAVRQLRGEAHPKVQVPNCDLALVHGTGGLLGVRHAAATAILERIA